ncbi:DUF4209 domain-containing protein [Bradyrhizobium oligotrophicum]
MISEEINKARIALKSPSEAENLGGWAEALGFALFPSKSNTSPWSTYFGPMATSVDAEGNSHYHPDIGGTPAEVLDHWAMRATSLKHPVLRARYADLAWDLAYAIGRRRRDLIAARTAIDNYLESASERFRSERYHQYDAVDRALDLAIQIKDEGRIDAARVAYMTLHRQDMQQGGNLWWRAVDRLLDEKKANLTEDEQEELIRDLEALVNQSSDPSATKFDPYVTENAARRLIKVYSRGHRSADVRRLHEAVAKAYERFADAHPPMLAAALLQTSMDAYERAGLTEDSKRVRVEMQRQIGESKSDMKPITSEILIQNDDLEKFLTGVIDEDLGSTFAKLAIEFLPKRKILEADVKETAKEAPLMAHISQKIMSDDRVAAIIGSVKDDLFGRLFQQAKFSFSFSHIWLLAAFQRLAERHDVLPEHFVGWANRHGIFEDMGLLLQGVRAWFEGDYVKAVHVLVPQIEGGVRSIAGQLGKPVTKAHPKIKGASVAINMGDILYSDEIVKKLGDDVAFYLLALYADPRGLNLRNQLAHGQLRLTSINDHTARLLIHTLLVLGLWKEFAESFAQTQAQSVEEKL